MKVDTATIKETLVQELRALAAGAHKRVCFIQFGTDAASATFVAMKVKLAKAVGIEATVVQSDVTDTAEALTVLSEAIEQEYDGIVVQLPLPEGVDADIVLDSIPTEMDIDMLSEDSFAHYRAGTTERTAPVASAIQEILWHHKILLPGKNIAVLGKGKLVGEPVMMLLDRQELPYTVFDIESSEAEKLGALAEADVVISGTGAAHSVTAEMVKEGVVLIDAGTSEQKGVLAGDVDPSCYEKAQWYTPVPGGVGPLTVACLFRNLFVH